MTDTERPRCCQNCARAVTKRNAATFITFLGRPLCVKWRPCHRRKLGYSAPPRPRPPRLRFTTFPKTVVRGRRFAARVEFVTIGGETRCVSL